MQSTRQYCGYFLQTPQLIDEETGASRGLVEHFIEALDTDGQPIKETVFVPLAPEKVTPNRIPPFSAMDFEAAKSSLSKDTIGSGIFSGALRTLGLQMIRLANTAAVAVDDVQIGFSLSQTMKVDAINTKKKRAFSQVVASTEALDLKKSFKDVDNLAVQELHGYMSNYRRLSDEDRQYKADSVGLLARIIQEIPRDENSGGTSTVYCPSIKALQNAFKQANADLGG